MKFGHNLNNPVLKALSKLPGDIPINARVTSAQSFKNLHTFILRHPCWLAKARPQPIFPYNIIENSSASFARDSLSVGLFSLLQMTSNLVQGHVV